MVVSRTHGTRRRRRSTWSLVRQTSCAATALRELICARGCRATLIGGRLLTAVTLASLAFYIYVGVTGGITDGFDRFSEPIEDIRDTMAREGTAAIPPQSQMYMQ